MRPADEFRATRAGGRPSVTKLCQQLLIGEYPRHEDATWLKDTFGVTAVHSLQDDEDLRFNGLDIAALKAAYDQTGITLVRTPIPDGSANALAAHLEEALANLQALVQAHERVYLHCNAGLNRAPTVAIAFMHTFYNMPLLEALAYVKQRRPCGPFMTVLEDYFGSRDHKPEK